MGAVAKLRASLQKEGTDELVEKAKFARPFRINFSLVVATRLADLELRV